jgi:tetratricopeptide (TPR) repeat protein
MSDTTLASLLLEASAAEARGDARHAAQLYERVVALAPRDAGVWRLLANARRLAGDTLGARDALRRAIPLLGRASPTERFEHARALVEAGDGAVAVPLFARVAAERPADAGAQAALAAALRDAGRLDTAITSAERAVALAPTMPTAYVTRGQIRLALGHLDDALADFEQALALRPDHAPTRAFRGHVRLLLGQHELGWADYESRALPVSTTGARDWHGETLDGASMLLMAEQGFGDQMQFLRFVDDVRARRAGRIVVEAHASVVSLLRANGYDAVPRGEAPHTDWAVPLLSLPHRLGLGAAVAGDRVPYLRATPGALPTLPAPDGRRRVGVVWSGNAEFSRNAERSLNDAEARALVHGGDVQWLALQQGPASRALEGHAGAVGAIADWETTARVLASLDLLVTTCTGIAHLAGAMGVRTWVLLHHVPDWRWRYQGDTSAWYPSVRLFRQPTPGDWASVIAAVHTALEHDRR